MPPTLPCAVQASSCSTTTRACSGPAEPGLKARGQLQRPFTHGAHGAPAVSAAWMDGRRLTKWRRSGLLPNAGRLRTVQLIMLVSSSSRVSLMSSSFSGRSHASRSTFTCAATTMDVYHSGVSIIGHRLLSRAQHVSRRFLWHSYACFVCVHCMYYRYSYDEC